MATSGSGGSSGSAGDVAQAGLSMASRLLKNPDCFAGDDPHSFAAWKFGFCSWLSFGDPRSQVSTWTWSSRTTQAERGHQTLLSWRTRSFSQTLPHSYLPTSEADVLVWFEVWGKNKNGFWLWRALVTEYNPASRQRSLAVAQALASYPNFLRANQ